MLLALTSQGLSRETAYGLVQRNALAVWESGGDFREKLESDPEVSGVLGAADLDRIFDYAFYTRHASEVIERALG